MGEVVVDALDRGIGRGLDVLFHAFRLVLGELRFLQPFEHIAADVADVDAAFLGEAVRVLDEFLAALAAHFGERDAHDLPVGDGVKTEVRLLNGLNDGFHESGIPRLNLDEARVGGGDGGAILQAHHGAVGFDHDTLDHRGRRFAGVDRAEFVQRVIHGFFHAGLGVGENGMRHGRGESRAES